jgi:uncharacterized protein
MGLLTTEIRQFINEERLGFVATVCPDGTPNLSPKGTTIAWDENSLVFADVCSPGTVSNLHQNPAIEINVVDPFVRKGYRIKGTAKVLSEGTVFEEAVQFYRQKGTTLPIAHIVFVTVERVLPIILPAYDTGRTEREIFEQWQSYRENLNRERLATITQKTSE